MKSTRRSPAGKHRAADVLVWIDYSQRRIDNRPRTRTLPAHRPCVSAVGEERLRGIDVYKLPDEPTFVHQRLTSIVNRSPTSYGSPTSSTTASSKRLTP